MPNPNIIRRGGGAWTPLKLPGLQLWLRSDRGLYQESTFATLATADGDPVGGWQDQSGRGNHFIQATAGKRPTLKLAQYNGLPGVRLDGVDDTLGRVAPPIFVTQSYSMALLHKINTVQSNGIGFANGGSNITDFQLNGTTLRSVGHGGVTNINFGTPTTNLEIWTAVRDGTPPSVTVYLNGVAQTTSSAAMNTPSAASTIGSTSGTAFNAADVVELIVSNTNWSAVQLAYVNRWLGQRGAIAVP